MTDEVLIYARRFEQADEIIDVLVAHPMNGDPAVCLAYRSNKPGGRVPTHRWKAAAEAGGGKWLPLEGWPGLGSDD